MNTFEKDRKTLLDFTTDCDMDLFWAAIMTHHESMSPWKQRKEKRYRTEKLHPPETELIYFLQNKPKISNPSLWLPPSLLYCFFFISTLFSLSLSVPVSVLYLHLSPALCSGSGSGNRSVTCHYWSNSVIRHRALTVCSVLYAGTAGVLRTEVEIRFDTHSQARGDQDRRALRMCARVCMYICLCVSTTKECERGKQKRWRDWIFVFACLYAGACAQGHMTSTVIQLPCILGRDFRE